MLSQNELFSCLSTTTIQRTEKDESPVLWKMLWCVICDQRNNFEGMLEGDNDNTLPNLEVLQCTQAKGDHSKGNFTILTKYEPHVIEELGVRKFTDIAIRT